jgi:hypothetical protein
MRGVADETRDDFIVSIFDEEARLPIMIIIQSSASSSHREGQNNKVDYSAQTPEGGDQFGESERREEQ